MPADPEIASRAETKAALLDKSRRRNREIPIRRSFLQIGSRPHLTPGPLAELVTSHNARALDAYLLLLAIASGPPHHINIDGKIGLRPVAVAIGLKRGVTGANAMSKAVTALEARQLLSRIRDEAGRRVLRLNKEDASGEPYVHPFRSRPRATYFKLSFDYWHAGYDERLNLAGKAVLLIGLSLSPWFVLPAAHVRHWYGISADTLHRGTEQLAREGILTTRKDFKKAPLAPIGYTQEVRYRLLPPFGRPIARRSGSGN